jgi:putative ABC transport system permease protein
MEPAASLLTADGAYFRTMRIPLKQGRLFDARDRSDSMPVVLINETFAQKYFPNKNPIGQRLDIGNRVAEGKQPCEIVGIVGTAKHGSLAEPNGPEYYLCYAQNPDRYMDLVVRASQPAPSGLETMIRRTVHEIDAQQFVPAIRPLSEMVSQTLSQSRFNSGLLAVFAAVAIILAAVGIYGVIAYNVAQRTREIGIRMALGAQRRAMLTMILRQSLTMAAIGIALGLVGAFAATRLLSALLFGIAATDVATYVSVVLLLGAAAFLAGLFPARRAMKVDPVVALHYE